MCLLITPSYACGHKDTGWLLYCNPTRKIFGRKHPPLEVCHGKDVRKQDWNVFEPRCSKCERRHRAGMEKETKRHKSNSSSSGSSISTSIGGGSLARRRTVSLLSGIREMLKIENGFGSRKERALDSDSDKGDTSEVDSLQMPELRNAVTFADEDGEIGAIGVEPRVVGHLPRSGSSSSLDSLPCSPRTSISPASQDYFT